MRNVVVRDVDIPFNSMVWFMVKWAIAAIPAILVLAVIVGVVIIGLGLVGGVLGGVVGAFHPPH
jgi:hypothetical protein